MFRRLAGAVLGEVMSLALALILIHVAWNLTLLLDAATCVELIPLIVCFGEVEVVAAFAAVGGRHA